MMLNKNNVPITPNPFIFKLIRKYIEKINHIQTPGIYIYINISNSEGKESS